MSGLASILRGLATHAASSVMMLVVALVATAAATAGPAYYEAARTSILRDTVASSSYLGHGFEVTQSGSVVGTVDPFVAEVQSVVAAGLGGRTAEQRLFAPPISALEATAFLPKPSETMPLVWRTDFCAHLQIRGACPQVAGQVVISSSLSTTNSWPIGQRVRFAQWGALTVTGIYAPPNVSEDYWFGHASDYFPYENPVDLKSGNGASYDAMFTPQATIEAAPSAVQGTHDVDELLDQAAIRAGDVGSLQSAVTGLANSPTLADQQAIVTTEIPDTLGLVKTAWSSSAVPIFLVTMQLLGLAWLLLFLVVTDTVDARGPEVALAKLRGHGRLRTVVFGLSEPLSILVVCLPLGALAGWGATGLLARSLLRSGTPVNLPGLGWAAAAAATVGGVAAVGLAAQRTLRRPIVEQWRRAGRHATDRGWVVDGILLSGAAAGLLELTLSGEVSSTSHGALSLLVPGLLGLAIAVVASRLLPLACRVMASQGHRFGGLATFLAVRHVARRPGGIRTTIMLATSLALATFAIAAWAVSRHNDQLVADAQVGAPTVLTVTAPPGQDLGTIVDRADPSGGLAATVDEFSSNGTVTVAVDSARFARVASWHREYSRQSLATLADGLDPPAPSALVLDGDAVRVMVTVSSLSPSGAQLQMDVVTPQGTGSTPVALGLLPAAGTATLVGQLAGCPCTVQDLTLVPVPQSGQAPGQVMGTLVLSRLEVHRENSWTTVGGAFTTGGSWKASQIHSPPDQISFDSSGLRWQFDARGTQDLALVSVNRPDPLPAIVARPLATGGSGTFDANGLGGQALPVRVIAAVAAVPGAPANGVLVDRRYAELAAGGNLSQITQQVWLAKGAEPIEARLRAAGVGILSAQSAAEATAVLQRQGPGLATVLFLAEGGAAAILAASGAVLGLYLSGRRRRYEYAALAVSGLSRRTLFGALIVEQLVVLVFGIVVGIASGLAAAALALRDVPEFLAPPVAPPLTFLPPAGELAAILSPAVVIVLLATVMASATLIRGVRLDILREAPA